MVELRAFHICKLTGFADLEIWYNANGCLNVDKRTFANEQNALFYIQQFKTQWIQASFKKYLLQQKYLISAGYCYTTAGKLSSLAICLQALQGMENAQLPAICAQVVKIEKELHHILPPVRNTAYEESSELLTDIMVFCKQELHIIKH